MTDIIIHKHSITAGDAPEPAELSLGELAIQAADGHIYLKKTDGTVNRVTMLPGGTEQQVLYKTNAGDYALGWGTITSTLMGGTLWSEVVAEVQRVFELVEGTASVLLSAPATLTAGSTGPITVSVTDTDYLADGTSITGVLGTVYGTLSRSGSTYSFESVQSYTSDVNFATGTRFAAAFLNDTFNPLRIGSAEVEDDDSYTEGSGYARVEVDENGRIAWGIKTDGTVAIKKALVEGSSTVQGNSTVEGNSTVQGNSTVEGNSTFENDVTIQGDLTVQGTTVTIDVTDLAIEDNTILLNKGETGSGVTLGSAGIEVDRGTADNVKLEWNEANQAWTAEESIRTNSRLFISGSSSESSDGYTDVSGYSQVVVDSASRIGYGVKNDGAFAVPGGNIILDDAEVQEEDIYTDGSGYHQVVLDSSDRIGYGLKSDGSFDINGAVSTKEDKTYDVYVQVELDSANRITRAVRPTGEQYIPKAEIGQLTANSLSIGGSTAGLRSDSLGGGLLGLFESRTDGTNHQIYRYYNGVENQLTTQGNNFGISLTDEAEKRILFYTTRNDVQGTGASEPYVMDIDGGRQVPALGTSDITMWGDSMSGTFSVSTTQQSFIDAGETDYSRVFRNQGSGGLSSVVIAMQMGVAGWTVEFPGGQINASGNTTVTNNRAAIYTDFATEQGINLDPFTYSNFPAKMPRQVVGGVIGKIRQQTATSVTTTASGSAGGSTVTVADASGIETGMLVKQTNGNEDKIILGTTVTDIDGTTISLSATNLSDLSSDSLDFYYEGGYVFDRETAGDAVPVNGPQEVVPITNYGYGSDQGYPQTDMEDLLNSIQILWPFGPHGSGGNDPATMEMIVLDAMINKGLTALSKKYVMLNAVASSTKAITNAQNNGTIVRTTDDVEQAYFDNYGDRYLSIINTSLNGDLSLPIDDFKTWFSTNYPSIYASDPDYGWSVPGGNNVYRQTTTSGVTGVTLVGNGGSGVQSATSVDTTTTGSGLALRLGVVASGGVATAIWVREPGLDYAVNDTVTIPAGTIGNASDITATVSSIGTSSPGNDVFNQNGSLDVTNAYNEWDINNGYMPRAMFNDAVHLSPYGKEYVRLMVAKFILNQGW